MQHQKGKTGLDFIDARDDGVELGSGISWTIRNSLEPPSRQIKTPAPHHLMQAGTLKKGPSGYYTS